MPSAEPSHSDARTGSNPVDFGDDAHHAAEGRTVLIWSWPQPWCGCSVHAGAAVMVREVALLLSPDDGPGVEHECFGHWREHIGWT